MKRKIVLLCVGIASLLLLWMVTPAAARRFWGKEKTKEFTYIDENGNLYIERCYNHYIFWIKVKSKCTPEKIDSSEITYE